MRRLRVVVVWLGCVLVALLASVANVFTSTATSEAGGGLAGVSFDGWRLVGFLAAGAVLAVFLNRILDRRAS